MLSSRNAISMSYSNSEIIKLTNANAGDGDDGSNRAVEHCLPATKEQRKGARAGISKIVLV